MRNKIKVEIMDNRNKKLFVHYILCLNRLFKKIVF
jgi:hypothetical protein